MNFAMVTLLAQVVEALEPKEYIDQLGELPQDDAGQPTMMDFIDGGLPKKNVVDSSDYEGRTDTSEPQVGWRGRGLCRRVRVVGREKPFDDGGGLCSPARWTPRARRVPGPGTGDVLER